MTDGIHRSWFHDRRNPRSSPQYTRLETQALRDALHTAVGAVRRALRDTPSQWRSGTAYSRFLGQLAGYGIVIGLRDGLLDIPDELASSSAFGQVWATRTTLHHLVRDLASDEELRALVGSDESFADELADDLDRIVAEVQLLGTDAVWRKHVAEPLARLDELWLSAMRAVLHRDPAAADLLACLDAVLPSASGKPIPLDPPALWLTGLRTRIIEGDIAWEFKEPCVSRQLPRETAGESPRLAQLAAGGSDGMPANPWLGLGTSAVTALPPRAVARAVEFLWDWTRRLCLRLHTHVASGVAPAMVAIYWEAVARTLALLTPHASEPGARRVPAEPAARAVWVEPAVPVGLSAAPSPAARRLVAPVATGPTPPKPVAAPPVATVPGPPPLRADPSPPPAAPASERAPVRPLATADPVVGQAATVPVNSDIRCVLETIARTLPPISATPERRLRQTAGRQRP
ncbi:hypothetical protein [Yinghuangia sp. YIM S09857]|uniref:hypothetical protein n=1 Tax=Yinghuangia sp. YIM S09857 TaxID=3436929 RepID=UPI003F532A5B